MKQTKTWLYTLLLIIGVVSSKVSIAQKGPSCDSAKVLTYPINNSVISYTNSSYWFKVTLNSGNYNINVSKTSGTGKIYKGEVYIGSCSSLTLVSTDTLAVPTNNEFNIKINNSVGSTTYYIKLYNTGGSVSFNKTMATALFITGQFGFCPGQQVTLSAYPQNINGTPTYTWLPSGTGDHAINYTVTPSSTVAPTTYTLIYSDGGGTITKTVSIFPLGPNQCKNCEQVQNGHFEWFNSFPFLGTNISVSGVWTNANASSSDYFNVNFYDPLYKVPTNWRTTNTPAYNGNGYAGFATYDATYPNGREYIQSQLKCPLVPGQIYNVSFYTTLADLSSKATNNIGAYLSATAIYTFSPLYLNYIPQINSPSASVINYSSSNTWTQISGTVIGANQQYITIGNFYDDVNTFTANSTSPYSSPTFSEYFVDDVSVTPATPTLSASSSTISCNCSSTITLTAIGASSVYTTWTNGTTTYSGSVVSIPCPTVTTNYTCNLNLPCSTCVPITQTISVTVLPPPSLTVSASSSVSCSGQNVSLTASGATTYTWNPGALTGSVIVVNPTATTIYTVTGINGSCPPTTNTLAVTVNTSCACYSVTPLGTTGTISASPTTNKKYLINNNATINGNITFAGSEFQFATNITLTVAANSTLTIDRSHLYASGSSMWSGIVVLNGGRLNVINNSLIEDALKAVSISNNTSVNQVLTVDASIFNKNQTDIAIATYTQNIATYPFTITNSLFTSRLIAPCNSMANWPLTSVIKAATNPTVSPLQTPYINNTTYPVVTMLAPYSGKKPYNGISLTNVGFSNVTTTSSSYQEFVIGTSSGTNLYNVFDNHWVAVNASNSNVNITNTIFQNGFNLVFPSLYSIGIKSISSGLNYRLQVNSASYTNNCKFYDLTRSVLAQGLHDLNINYCEMYSTRIFNSGSASQFGAYGVSAISNHYRNVNLNYNKIFNHDNALVFNASVGSYTVGTTIGYGQYLGSINANNNTIRSHVTGYTPNPSLHYGFKAISLSSILGQANVTPANQIVYTNNNNIEDYENGIFCSNWPLHFTYSRYNTVTIRNAASVVQYGIEHDNNNSGATTPPTLGSHGIAENFVTANAVSTNPSNYAIRSSQNTASAVNCNTVSNTYNGIAFSGTTVYGSFFRYNDFTGNNKYGFVLENAGVIGQQGASNAGPTDNRWLGSSWVFPNFKTATLGTSTAINSRLYIRLTPSDFYPAGSAYTDLFAGIDDYYYSGSTGTLRQGNNASYTGCSYNRPINNNSGITTINKVAIDPIPNLMEEIVVAQANSSKQAQALSVAKDQVFLELKQNPELLDNSTILSDFYTNNQNNEVDVLSGMEESIVSSNTTAIQSNLAGYSPQTNSGIKHKQFLALFLKYQSQGLNTTDEQQLLTLAQGCPSLDGTFVHEARTLYNVAFDKNNNFKDNCNITVKNNNARSGQSDNEGITENVFANGILLFPNPSATGEVVIMAGDDSESLEVEITNSNGLNIWKQSVSLDNHSAKLSLNAASGVYMVIVTNPKTKQRVIKKLVIQK